MSRTDTRRARGTLGTATALGTAALLVATGCSSPASADAPRPTVSAVTSSAVALEWPAVAGATRVRVYVGAEPGATRDATLPDARLVATLPGSADDHRIEHLAANVDVFVRVEADTSRGTMGGNVHVHTRGGPRAELDGPVREVQGFSPTVLRVTLANVDGAAAARGRWSVQRRNGQSLRVLRVRRHSVPVGQPEYDVRFGGNADIDNVDVDHVLYLELAARIGQRDVLRVQGPGGVDILVPFSDRYLETPVVQLNQVGYNPRATARWAYVSGWMGDGGPLALDHFPTTAEALAIPTDAFAARTVVTPGLPVTRRSGLDTDTGAPVSQIDLARIPAGEGVTLRIRVPGVGVSFPTQVSELAVLKAYWVATRGLLHNRWGGDLRASVTDWTRPADHLTVFTAEQRDPFAMFPESTPRTGERPLRGGYHDAGDFDQRPMHTVVPQLLMRAYELAPTLFPDRQLCLPESGNGVPDLLDEALWGVSGWEQLQESDGGVRAGVESHRHPLGIYPANDDELPYWTFARNANVTARAAGVFAQASRLLAPFDRTRAARLRRRAIDAERWATAHQASRPFMLYALSELARLTGDPRYRARFEQTWAGIGEYGAFSSFAGAHDRQYDYGGEGRVMPDYILGYLATPGARQDIIDTSREWLTRMADEAARATIESPHAHRNPRPADAPTGWGDGTVMGRWLDPVIARMAFGPMSTGDRQNYVDALSVAADYVLGANPLGMVFMTGLGSRRPEEPLHLDSLATIKRGLGPMPGIPVYGPISEVPGQDWYQPGARRFSPAWPSTPPMRRYADLHTFVNTNECTIWECQAPDAEHFAALLGAAWLPPTTWLPGHPDHRNPLPGASPARPARRPPPPTTTTPAPPANGRPATAPAPASSGAAQ